MRAIEKLRAGPKVMELRENWSYGPGGVEKTLLPGAVDAHWLAGICEKDRLAPPELFEIDAKGPAPEPAVEASALAALRRGPPPPEIDQELFEQVRRIQVMAVKMLNENKTPDCVIVASSSPLGRETEGRVSIPTGWLKVFPDAQCPWGYEYVGLEEELFPLSSKGCQRHFLPLPCTACHAEQTWPPGGYMTAKSNPLGPNYHPPAKDRAPAPKPTTNMSHEERARAWIEENKGNGMVAHVRALAAAFAEVEAEAMARVTRDGFVEQTGVGQYKVDLGERIECSQIDIVAVKVEPAFCQECGKDPCESFIRCQMAAANQRILQGYRELKMPEAKTKSCTCGVTSVGSRLHSEWCDLS